MQNTPLITALKQSIIVITGDGLISTAGVIRTIPNHPAARLTSTPEMILGRITSHFIHIIIQILTSSVYNQSMPWWNFNYYTSFHPERFFLLPLLAPAAVWSLFWKGIALYRSARNEQKKWFIAILLLNTLGILEIVYLLFFSTKHSSSRKKSSN